ncbi:MAG: hypothetical protein RR259_10185, partial [Odoribacter sp.]
PFRSLIRNIARFIREYRQKYEPPHPIPQKRISEPENLFDYFFLVVESGTFLYAIIYFIFIVIPKIISIFER